MQDAEASCGGGEAMYVWEYARVWRMVIRGFAIAGDEGSIIGEGW